MNPLDAALAYETAGASYEQILGYTLKLLSMCDGIIMTGKDESWRESRGCMTELHYAVANGFQEIYESPVDFMRKMRLRKEAMGAIHLGFSEEKGFSNMKISNDTARTWAWRGLFVFCLIFWGCMIAALVAFM